MASIRKAKKMGTYVPKQVNKQLLAETREMVQKVNKRLRNLERGDNYNSWASKKLFERLDAKSLGVLDKTRKGKHIRSVKLNKGLTNTDLHAIQKASRQFLTSKTSTSRGIADVEERTKDSMYKDLKIDKNRNISRKDVETYYEMLSNKDFDYFNEKVGASTMWNAIEDAKDSSDDKKTFVERISAYAGIIPDEDVRGKITRLYDLYVKPGALVG